LLSTNLDEKVATRKNEDEDANNAHISKVEYIRNFEGERVEYIKNFEG
jgi:hypothetical protein